MTILDKGTSMSPEQRATQEAKTPHSGNTGVEFPVREFKDTTLEQAVDQGLVTVPEGYDPDEPLYTAHRTVMPRPDDGRTTETKKPERKKGWKKWVAIGTGAVVAATGGGIWAATNMNNESQPTATAEPSGETPAGTGDVEDPTPVETEGVTEETLEISAEQTNEEIAQDVVELFSEWEMAGATQENFDARYTGDNVGISLQDYAATIAASNAAEYANAIYGTNVTNPEFSEAIALSESVNANALFLHFSTYGAQNDAQYESTLSIQSINSIVENPDGTTTYNIDVEYADNASQTILPNSADGYEMTAAFTTVNDNGVIRLASPVAFTPN